MRKLLCLVLALFFMSLSQAFADYYTFSYVDGAFDVSGALFTAPGVGPSLTVTGGSLNTAAFTAELYTGSGPIPAGTSATSPAGAFYYDNDLYPGSTPMLSNQGLLFAVGTPGTAGYEEINIFGNSGPNDYSYYEGTGAGNFFNVHNNGTFTVTQVSAVPVPPSVWLLGAGLLGLIGLRRRLTK